MLITSGGFSPPAKIDREAGVGPAHGVFSPPVRRRRASCLPVLTLQVRGLGRECCISFCFTRMGLELAGFWSYAEEEGVGDRGCGCGRGPVLLGGGRACKLMC